MLHLGWEEGLNLKPSQLELSEMRLERFCRTTYQQLIYVKIRGSAKASSGETLEKAYFRVDFLSIEVRRGLSKGVILGAFWGVGVMFLFFLARNHPAGF